MTAPQAAPGSSGRRLAATVLSTRPADQAVDLGLVVARAGLAWIFFYYGAEKLFGWFNGGGVHEFTLFFANTAGLKPGGLFAVLGGLLEFGGAIAIAVGLGTRLIGLALAIDMVMAMVTVTWSTGLEGSPGYGLNIALCALALIVALLGAGRYSLDAVAERRLAAPAR
jgi:putative oxidoreductase